ncbi:MAG: copper chaperone Copz family protein [Chloroflexi bacterium]|nr:copper chaperone Copz family protein [Chloroflexota bacterium]
MAEICCSVSSAGSATCELPAPAVERLPRVVTTCPVCGEKGKPVQGQTVKALLSVTLRQVENGDYMFCGTRTCPVVYFSADGKHTFTTDQVRERVYQKEPEAGDVKICYCFQHTVGEIRHASSEARNAILNDINAGIQADQCACDLRNPQGSCCLGNVRGLIKRFEQSSQVS